MKKRLRKKLHKGEYKETGVSIRVLADQAAATEILDSFAEIADENGLIFCGGGIGHIMLPSEQYGDLTMPGKVEYLMCALAADPYLLTDCILGYFMDPTNKIISLEKIASIKNGVEGNISTEYQINPGIDLWN